MDTLDRSQPYDALCVAAHPDDVEMAMGGTVAALVAAGRRVAIVDLTGGELGTHGDAVTRAAEAAAAARELGVDRAILDFPDGGVVDSLENRHRVAKLLRELRPDTVFAPWPHATTGPWDGRSNVDHLATGLLVREGSKLARFRKLELGAPPHGIRRLYYYMAPDDRRPDFVADVSAHEERLRAGIAAHASQMAITRADKGPLEFLMLWRRMVGMRIGVELGEAFVCEDALGGDPATLLQI